MIEIFILALAVSADCRCAPADDKLISFMLTPHPIPLWDYMGRPLLGGIFLVLLLLQWQFPRRRQHFSALRRLARNFVLSIPGFAIVRLSFVFDHSLRHRADHVARFLLHVRSRNVISPFQLVAAD